MTKSQLNISIRILLYCGILFFFHSCENDLSALPQLDEKIERKDQAETVTIIISQHGETKIKIEADTMNQKEQPQMSYIDLLGDVKISFYNDSLARETYITGEFARYYSENKNALIQDNVVVSNMTGDSLFSEEIIWNEKLKMFYTEQDVTISMGGERSTGTGLEANEDLSWIRIHQQKGNIPVDSDELPFED